MRNMRDRVVLPAFTAVILALSASAPAVACSPPFEKPTIAALGPDAVVVVGTIGAPVPGGRLFHVERAFNGVDASPIVIGFKEGEAIGDCSYPVQEGTRLIMAPDRLPDGTLYADLVTLQADPLSDVGRAYVAEAVALFGPGVEINDAVPKPDLSATLVLAIVAVVVLLLFAIPMNRRRQAGGVP